MHDGRIPIFRGECVRSLAQGRGRHRARGRAGGRRSPGARGAGRRRARPRARESEDRAGRRDPRGHRSHRRRAHPRARQQRGAGPLAPRRHRLSSVAAAEASRHRRRRVDDPGARSDRGRIGLSSGRRLGRRRHRRAGLVLRRQGRNRPRIVGARAGADGPRAPDQGRSPCRRARRAACLRAGRPVRDQGADDPQDRFVNRGTEIHDDIAGGHPDRPRSSRNCQPRVRPRAGLRRELGRKPSREPCRPVRRHGAFRSVSGERRGPVHRAARTGIRGTAASSSSRARRPRYPQAAVSSGSSSSATTARASCASSRRASPGRG